MKKLICKIIFIASIAWLLGLAGASDLDTLPFGEIVAQMIVALSALLASASIGGII